MRSLPTLSFGVFLLILSLLALRPQDGAKLAVGAPADLGQIRVTQEEGEGERRHGLDRVAAALATLQDIAGETSSEGGRR